MHSEWIKRRRISAFRNSMNWNDVNTCLIVAWIVCTRNHELPEMMPVAWNPVDRWYTTTQYSKSKPLQSLHLQVPSTTCNFPSWGRQRHCGSNSRSFCVKIQPNLTSANNGATASYVKVELVQTTWESSAGLLQAQHLKWIACLDAYFSNSGCNKDTDSIPNNIFKMQLRDGALAISIASLWLQSPWHDHNRYSTAELWFT